MIKKKYDILRYAYFVFDYRGKSEENLNYFFVIECLCSYRIDR